LEGAMVRMFPGPRSRGVVSSRLRGMLAVVIVLGAMIAAILMSVSVPVVTTRFGVDLGTISAVLAPIVASAAGIAVAFLIYVMVPPDAPTFRAASLPAFGAGIVIGLLTSLFSFVGQYLVGAYVGLGVVGTIFIALVWFDLVFQILLYGAAVARWRRDAERRRAGPPHL